MGQYTWHAEYTGNGLNFDVQDDGTGETVTTVAAGLKAGDFTTYTQGGWSGRGAPGQYLQANFLSAFSAPNYIYVGGTQLTSAADVQTFLKSSASELQKQTLTLALNVGFDAWDANFSQSSTPFGSLKLKDLASDTKLSSYAIALNGQTISDVLTAAQAYLTNPLPSGSLPYGFTTEGDLTYLVTQLNESFDNGDSITSPKTSVMRGLNKIESGPHPLKQATKRDDEFGEALTRKRQASQVPSSKAFK